MPLNGWTYRHQRAAQHSEKRMTSPYSVSTRLMTACRLRQLWPLPACCPPADRSGCASAQHFCNGAHPHQYRDSARIWRPDRPAALIGCATETGVHRGGGGSPLLGRGNRSCPGGIHGKALGQGGAESVACRLQRIQQVRSPRLAPPSSAMLETAAAKARAGSGANSLKGTSW